MSMIERSLDSMAALTAELGDIVRRRLSELSGIILISLALMGALALASWSVRDPSLSHATDAPVHNWLGWPGAVTADLMMQLLGLGALALILPVAIWGYRLLGHRGAGRERLRVILWPVGAALASGFASCLPRSIHWPLPCGLFHLPLSGAYNVIAAIVLGGAATVALATASGLLWHDADMDIDDDEEDEDDAEERERDRERGWISLGLLAHSILSLRARLSRLFGRRRRMPMPSADSAMRGR